MTTLLDPRFKKIPFSSQTSVEHTTNRIVNEMKSLGSDGTDNSDSGTCTSATHSLAQSLWITFDQNVAESTSQRNVGTDCIIEVRRYFEEPNTSRSSNPLHWWKNNASRFPRLHKVASKYLGVPGSSVPSERLFSKAGQLVSERRNRLKAENIDMILFLNHNIKLVD